MWVWTNGLCGGGFFRPKGAGGGCGGDSGDVGAGEGVG